MTIANHNHHSKDYQSKSCEHAQPPNSFGIATDVWQITFVFACGPHLVIFRSFDFAVKKYCFYPPTTARSRLYNRLLMTSADGCSTPAPSRCLRKRFKDIATPEILHLVVGSVQVIEGLTHLRTCILWYMYAILLCITMIIL